jgi:hypothetical protein
MKLQALTVSAFLVCASTGASAQTMKPGLWEITMNMHSQSGQMEQNMARAQQQMAAMPPEQRKMMEEMMAQRGVKLGSAGPQGMSPKVCLTKEQIERNQMPTQQRGDCQSSNSRSGNTVNVKFTCSSPPSTGEGQITITSPDSYSMKMVVNTTMQGRPERMDMDGSGKWLGADCGSVKPMQMPGAK